VQAREKLKAAAMITEAQLEAMEAQVLGEGPC
jgi:hypothetical protein